MTEETTGWLASHERASRVRVHPRCSAKGRSRSSLSKFGDVRTDLNRLSPSRLWGGGPSFPGDLAGQEARGERKEGKDTESETICCGGHLDFDLPAKQAPLVLNGHEGFKVEGAAGPMGVRHHPTGKVGAADVAHFSGPDHGIESVERLGDGRLRVGKVQLEKIDVVSAQRSEARFQRADQLGARSAVLDPL